MLTGCYRGKPLGEVVRYYNLNCFQLTREQGDIVRTVGKFFPSLTVSAPSYWPTGGGTWDEEPHHVGTTKVDFGAPPERRPDLLRAFLTLSRVWGGGLGIGLSQPGRYSAQIHLHVDGRMGDGRYNRWIETQLSDDGKMIASVIPSDEIVYQTLPGLQIIKREKKPGIWKATLADAAKIYGYSGGADQEIIDQIKGTDEEPAVTADSLPVIGGVIGGALGYYRDKSGSRDWLKLGLYAGAGIAVGAILREIKKGVELWSGQ